MEKHTFHIPVMGIGYTADSPLKVAVYGIDSVISLVDDILLEKLRKYYCEKNHLKYIEITNSTPDFRALRITAYLNLLNQLIQKKIDQLKHITTLSSPLLKDYIKHLPEGSLLKQKLLNSKKIEETRRLITQNIQIGAMDVNIMTKVDKTNYKNAKALPDTFNDAHAALRGYANSNVTSSIVFSAGMNPKLFNYLATLDAFYPDSKGYISKKIILKVSDYRSAIIQGKYLAKKGLWVSEYRIESGLNCGGHAFATDGILMGPVLEEFKNKRILLFTTVYEIFKKGLQEAKRKVPTQKPSVKITAQGGVGTADEHQFLLDYYQLDTVGWGSPFLLVPEATTVDANTLQQLASAKEKDLYLSNISPLGIRFNNLKGNTKDVSKQTNILKNRPGSACPKKHVALNTEYKKEGLCTASREYQYLKIKELEANLQLTKNQRKKEINQVTEKSCICVGLGTSALLKYNLDTKREGTGVSVCPGPNITYFKQPTSLKNIMLHIYGTKSLFTDSKRPQLFIKELSLYINYFKEQMQVLKDTPSQQLKKKLLCFVKNLLAGIAYYKQLFHIHWKEALVKNTNALEELAFKNQQVLQLQLQLQKIKNDGY